MKATTKTAPKPMHALAERIDELQAQRMEHRRAKEDLARQVTLLDPTEAMDLNGLVSRMASEELAIDSLDSEIRAIERRLREEQAAAAAAVAEEQRPAEMRRIREAIRALEDEKAKVVHLTRHSEVTDDVRVLDRLEARLGVINGDIERLRAEHALHARQDAAKAMREASLETEALREEFVGALQAVSGIAGRYSDARRRAQDATARWRSVTAPGTPPPMRYPATFDPVLSGFEKLLKVVQA